MPGEMGALTELRRLSRQLHSRLERHVQKQLQQFITVAGKQACLHVLKFNMKGPAKFENRTLGINNIGLDTLRPTTHEPAG